MVSFALSLLLLPQIATAQVTQRDTIEIQRWRLVGDRVTAAGDPAPFVLMLNKAAGNRFVYGELARLLAERGIGSLRVDLPGHGQSTNLGTVVPGDQSGIVAEPRVVAQLLEHVRSMPSVDTARIGIVAGSYSAELAAQASRATGYAAAYVMLSPGNFSDSSFSAIGGSGADWLMVRSPNERFVREWLDTLARRNGAELWISDANAAHATDILAGDPTAARRIADWLTARLRAPAAESGLRVTYLANEGVMLETPSGRVLIDALFGDGLEGYARVEPPVRDSLERGAGAFGGRALVLATHAHRDHFDAAAVARYVNANTGATAILPPDAHRTATELVRQRSRLRIARVQDKGVAPLALGWVTVRVLGMPHGQTSRPVDHASYLVELDGWTALHIGDTQLSPAEWESFDLPERGVDVAFMPYWYLLDEELASELRRHARPRRIVVLHGPTPGAEGPTLQRLGGWARWSDALTSRYRETWVPSSPGEHRVFQRDKQLDFVRGIATRLRSLAFDTLGGLAWPADELQPRVVGRGLAEGPAGHVLFLLGLHELDPAGGWLADARRGGDFLLASLTESTPRDSSFWAATGLYGGMAGTGVALLQLYRTTGEQRFAAGVRDIVRRVDRAARRAGDGSASWGDGNDILNGAAGTLLFLLAADAGMQAPGARALAVAAGHGLIGRAERVQAGLRWRASPDSRFELPNFSHGTAGIAFALARLHRLTSDSVFLQAALEGAAYLRSVADTAGGTFQLFYGWPDPGWAQPYDLGWAHGPAGTARLFDELHAATGDSSWLALRSGALKAIHASGAPGPLPPRYGGAPLRHDTRFGLAGMIPFLLDRPGSERLAESYARAFTEAATIEDGTPLWVTERSAFMDRAGQPARFTGYFYGAAGYGLALLRVEAARRGMPWPLRLPDEPAIRAP